jgi:transposase-like protein
MQIEVKCPSCNTESSFFIAKNIFEGPFRCRNCKSLYTLKVKNGEMLSCEPLSQEDFDKAAADLEAERKKRKEK